METSQLMLFNSNNWRFTSLLEKPSCDLITLQNELLELHGVKTLQELKRLQTNLKHQTSDAASKYDVDIPHIISPFNENFMKHLLHPLQLNFISKAEHPGSLVWLHCQCEHSIKLSGLIARSPTDIMSKVLSVLLNEEGNVEGEALFDIIGPKSIDIIMEIIAFKETLLRNFFMRRIQDQLDQELQVKAVGEEGMSKSSKSPSAVLTLLNKWGFRDEANVYPKLAEKQKPAAEVPHGDQVETVYEKGMGYEQFTIPAPESFKENPENLISLTKLPWWAQKAFPHIKSLNTVQSKVFQACFVGSKNILVCAPTGAGKTNIALLALLRSLGQHMDEAGKVKSAAAFKCIYIAPMKSLVAEVVQKFSEALQPLGVVVAEMTGDIQLTAKERDSTHIIVTVPEKWDILTRNRHKHRLQKDADLLSCVQCLIIDEIHLLNEDRGPVIEAIVARSLQHMERTQQLHRLVGISATMPNWQDIAKFLRVDLDMAFVFGAEYRPVPLEQTFVGVISRNPSAATAKLNERCYNLIGKYLKERQQILVFVHSRNDTYRTAKGVIEYCKHTAGLEGLLHPEDDIPDFYLLEKRVRRSRSEQLKLLFMNGMGSHHAGLLREDKDLTEALFRKGIIRVLFSTATLAWGVNLPARTVIIKGTKIYSGETGGCRNIGILDVMQIFGRAGRPQYDEQGSAILICEADLVQHYLKSMSFKLPIESQLLTNLANMLNAEVAIGNINSISDAIDWIHYTFLDVRMQSEPNKYIGTQTSSLSASKLAEARRKFVINAAQVLDDGRLIRYSSRTEVLTSTDLGRVAAHFYVDYETAGLFCRELVPNIKEQELLSLFGRSQEFASIQVRDEEKEELDKLVNSTDVCRVQVLGGSDNNYGKVAILLQAYLSRHPPTTFSLMSDYNYVAANAPRLMRAMYEISLTETCNKSELADCLLEWCKMINARLWDDDCLLRHFALPFSSGERTQWRSGCLKDEVIRAVESAGLKNYELLDLTVGELQSIVGNYGNAKAAYDRLRNVPDLKLRATIQPITPEIIRINLKVSIRSEFQWSQLWNGDFEPFVIWVEDGRTGEVMYTETANFQKHIRELTLPIVLPYQPSISSQYIVKVISERWVNIGGAYPCKLNSAIKPSNASTYTELLDLEPLEINVLQNEAYARLYSFEYFNPVQTHFFHGCYHNDYNILVGAPTGSGKTLAAEFAILRLFTHYSDKKAIYISPMKSLGKERLSDWQNRFGKRLHKNVVELTGDVTPDSSVLKRADVLITTPEKWDGISRSWRSREYVKKVGLVIIDEIHLLGQQRGPVLEMIVSRMRYMSSHLQTNVRFVGLSTTLANAEDIAGWLGVQPMGLFNFKPSVRPVPCVVHVAGFTERNFCPRMAVMNRPIFFAIREHSPNKPVLVFVQSRRQTRLTAYDLISLMKITVSPDATFLKGDAAAKGTMSDILKNVKDEDLKYCLSEGVGIHHAGLVESDRLLVEDLYRRGVLQILVATSTLAWGVNFPAYLVIVKGTEYYDGQLKRYVDIPATDIMQMIGRAGRPQFDTSCVACVFVHEPKKEFYKRFLNAPFPVESSLHECLADHLNAEIAANVIASTVDAKEYISWTFLYRRLLANASYYDPTSYFEDELAIEAGNATDNTAETKRAKIKAFIDKLVTEAFNQLLSSKCIQILEPQVAKKEGMLPELNYRIESTKLGRTASQYYLNHRTIYQLYSTLRFTGTFTLTFPKILQLLCNSKEYAGLPVRHNEELLNGILSEDCPFPVDKKQLGDAHCKAYILLQCHMFGIQLPVSDYVTDLTSVLDQMTRILQAMIDIAADEAQLRAVLYIILLLQCLVQGTNPLRNSLHTILPLDEINLHHLAAFSISSIPELLEYPQGKLQIPNYNNRLLKLVMDGIPKLEVSFELYVEETDGYTLQKNLIDVLNDGNKGDTSNCTAEDVKQKYAAAYRVNTGAYLYLKFNFKYLNNPQKTAIASRLIKERQFGWYVILGDADETVDELIDFKRIQVNQNGTSKYFEFYAPDEANSKFCLSLIICNDSYFGIDQQYDIVIQTLEAENNKIEEI